MTRAPERTRLSAAKPATWRWTSADAGWLGSVVPQDATRNKAIRVPARGSQGTVIGCHAGRLAGTTRVAYTATLRRHNSDPLRGKDRTLLRTVVSMAKCRAEDI